MTNKRLDELYTKMKAGEITHLKYFLAIRGWTTSDLANATAINKRTLDDFVSGRREIGSIGLRNGLEIARVLDVDPYELF